MDYGPVLPVLHDLQLGTIEVVKEDIVFCIYFKIFFGHFVNFKML